MIRTDLVNRFGIWDYVVFSGMLCISAAIGLYYACTGGKQRTTNEFLMADRKMGTIVVGLSLLASFMSAITLLGTPAELYNYTSIYLFIGIGYCVTIPAAAHLYLPVFYKLGLTSSYEYLERRFNKVIRRFGSIVFIMQMSMYMAIVLYAPALALSQVTGLPVWGSVAAIGIVCTFYTTVGGMKAVMWTDAFQVFIMFGSMLTVVIKGCLDAGGPAAVWEKSVQGERIQFWDFDPNPTVRHSFWSLTIGGAFTWLAVYGVNQAQVQRYLTTPSMNIAQRALWWNLPGLVFLLLICSFGGLVIFATYMHCDPLTSKQIEFSDQLLPLFVMDTLGLFPGVPGLFVSGIFSGALSTISSGMNSLAAVTLEDFVRGCFAPNLSEKAATLTSKLLALFYGILCIALVAVAEKLGNVLQAALSIFGIVGGPLLGVFTLGMFFPCANSWGAGFGLVAGFSLSFWIGFGAQIYKSAIFLAASPVSVSGCQMNTSMWTDGLSNFTDEGLENSFLNFTTTTPSFYNVTTGFTESELNGTSSASEHQDVLEIYKISYLWFSFIACWTVVIVGLIVSCLTGKQDPETLDPALISPLVRNVSCCFPSSPKQQLHYSEHKEAPLTHSDVEKNGTVMQEKFGADNPAYNGNHPGFNDEDDNRETYTTAL